MAKKLFLLDGMALVYRAHFALIARPIFTSKGVNTSALYGFTQTLLDIQKKYQPTHIAVAFDTDKPTQRHIDFPEYKATRDSMPEDLSLALPHVVRMLDAFRIPVLTCDGYEADDLIGTLVLKAEQEGFTSYMVTPDKDFGQLVTANTYLYKPGRMGDSVEILGLEEIRARWGIQDPTQVVDILALMGDASDNIPGVPGIGEKTAIKLVSQFGTVENLLAHTGDLSGRVRESLEKNRDAALISKKLATIMRDAPCPVEIEALRLQSPDDEKLKDLFVEFEFNSIGRRLYGDDFKAGRGFGTAQGGGAKPKQPDLLLEIEEQQTAGPSAGGGPLKKLGDTPYDFKIVSSAKERSDLVRKLEEAGSFGFHVQSSSNDVRAARPLGLAFSVAPHSGWYVPVPVEQMTQVLEEFREVLESDRLEKTGHHLKWSGSVLRWHGIALGGRLFDTQIAHSLVEPDVRHTLEYVAEACLGYTPLSLATIAGKADADPGSVPVERLAELAVEAASLGLQLRECLEALLKQRGQERVFYDIEARLIPVLVDMECEGIRVDAAALADFAAQLSREITDLEGSICQAAGTTFNLNSPRQLGQILFEVLKICDAPKKTKTGQYATDEQTLLSLAPDHEVVRKLLEHRTASKLKSTYADALPTAIWPATGRVHTTYNQVATSTGRLNSQDPNLQNIPIRTERGQEIRKAFVPRDKDFLLLSADYSQIELRIIAALSREAGLLEAFRAGSDVHTTTAARVFGVFPELVTPEMRRKAKMVNYGIAYGISAFGLAQRLNIPRKEAAEIIDQYFKQFSGIGNYMDGTIEFCRKHGYVETVTGRRRYLRDINSSNNTVRSAAERNAINAPIQGTAADMIKIAMVNIHEALLQQKLRTRLLLQVHDELVFDLYRPEEAQVRALVQEKMANAIPLAVPIEVEMGVGETWLAAH